MEKIIFETERLVVRPFTLNDVTDVYNCCNDYDVIKTTLGLPWPYERGMAQTWIENQVERQNNNQSYEFAICFKENPNRVIGCVSLLGVNNAAKRAELGYWVCKPLWKQGIATEAARGMLKWGFKTLGLHSVIARYFDINPASGRVMAKCGMTYVGTIRDHEVRFGKYHNVGYYEMIESDLKEQ